MPMPNLFKYFAFVGGALLAMITLASFLLDPATVATTVATPAKPVIVVQHDPRASKIERWRNEQAALKAAAQTQTADNASLVTKSEQVRLVGVVTAPAQAQPVQPVQAPPAQSQASQAEPGAANRRRLGSARCRGRARGRACPCQGREGQGRQGRQNRPPDEAGARPRPGRSTRACPIATRPVAARPELLLRRPAAAHRLEPAGPILLRPARACA